MRIRNRILDWTPFGIHYAALMLWIATELLRRLATGNFWDIVSAVLILLTMVFFGLVPLDRLEPFKAPGPMRLRLVAAAAVLRGDSVIHGVTVRGQGVELIQGRGRKRMYIVDLTIIERTGPTPRPTPRAADADSDEVRRLAAKIAAREKPLLDRLAPNDGPEEVDR